MSVVITEIVVFLFFAALIGLAAGYWMRPRSRGGSADAARTRLQTPPASRSEPDEQRRMEGLLETVETERDAIQEARQQLVEQLAEVQAELESSRQEAQRLRKQVKQDTDTDQDLAALRNQLDSVREQLLAAQHEASRLRASLQYAEADRDAAIEAASQDHDKVESTTIQLEEHSAEDPPDPRRLRLLTPSGELSSSEVRSLRSAATDLEAAIAARDRIRMDRDRIRDELVRMKAAHTDLQERVEQRQHSRSDLDEALDEARQRLASSEDENRRLHQKLIAAESRVEEVSRSIPRSANPLTVRFVPVSGPIGPDARESRVRLVLDMAPGTPWRLRARRVQVTLDFELDEANIAINGRRSGPLVLAQDAELRPDQPMGIDLRVSTGAFSASVSQHRTSTPLGDHPVKVTVQFQLEPLGGRAGRAIAKLAMPVVSA